MLDRRSWVRLARRFLAVLARRGGDLDHPHVVAADRGLAGAFELRATQAAPRRHEVEARLLATEDDAATVARVGLDADVARNDGGPVAPSRAVLHEPAFPDNASTDGLRTILLVAAGRREAAALLAPTCRGPARSSLNRGASRHVHVSRGALVTDVRAEVLAQVFRADPAGPAQTPVTSAGPDRLAHHHQVPQSRSIAGVDRDEQGTRDSAARWVRVGPDGSVAVRMPGTSAPWAMYCRLVLSAPPRRRVPAPGEPVDGLGAEGHDDRNTWRRLTTTPVEKIASWMNSESFFRVPAGDRLPVSGVAAHSAVVAARIPTFSVVLFHPQALSD